MLGAMDHTLTALERAFALAKSGDYASVPDIRKRLIQEGYSASQITGRSLSKQLLALIRAAQERAVPKGPEGQERPADMIGAAVKVMKIAMGDDGKDKLRSPWGGVAGRRGPRN
jgi:hypothetical protein